MHLIGLRVVCLGAVLIVGRPKPCALQHTSEASRGSLISLKTAATLRDRLARRFVNLFSFAMNDDVVHTGCAPVADCLPAMAVGLQGLGAAMPDVMTPAETMIRIERLVAQGLVREAAEVAAAALWQHADQPDLLLAMAALNEHLGETELALGAYERACAVAADRVDAWRGWVDALTHAGRAADAGPGLARLMALQPPIWQQVTVEVTTYCNLKCRGCARTIDAARGQWTNRHMSVDSFRRIVEAIPPTAEIVTQGVGEPTLHPDLPGIIAVAAGSGKFGCICFTTNALVRDADYHQELFDRGLSHLLVSVDSLEPDLAQTVRGGTNASDLRERLAILLRRFPGRVIVEITLGGTNLHGLAQTLADLQATGAGRVNIHPFDDMGLPDDCLSRERRAAIAQVVPDLRRAFPGLHIEFHNADPSPAVCRHPLFEPAIRVDGSLTPCCRILDDGGFSFGNLLEQSFEEVWFGTATDRWRRAFEQRSPDLCAGCPMFLPRPGA